MTGLGVARSVVRLSVCAFVTWSPSIKKKKIREREKTEVLPNSAVLFHFSLTREEVFFKELPCQKNEAVVS